MSCVVTAPIHDSSASELMRLLANTQSLGEATPIEHQAVLRWLIEESLDHQDEGWAADYVSRWIYNNLYEDQPDQAVRLAVCWLHVARSCKNNGLTTAFQEIIAGPNNK